MAGSIRKGRRHGACELRVYVGRDGEGRVRHRHRQRTVTGTRRSAERELARLVVEQENAPAAVPEAPSVWGPTTTVNAAVEAWRDNGWADLSPKTVRGYEELWKRYVEDAIGRRRIASLNPYEVERYFRGLKDGGAGKDTVRRVRNLLHRACRLAARWSGGVLANPIAGTELPSWPITERKVVRAPDPAEVRTLLAAALDYDERFATFVRLVAATGMRRGEACALRWSDVDWDAGLVAVDESIVTARGGAVVKSPKTRASIRRLALDSGTLDALRARRSEQRVLDAQCGIELAEGGFVFSTEPGGDVPPHPEAMTHAFIKVRERAGLAADVHLHSLRHFQATVLDTVIPERQKQVRLGWSTVHMARHYTDALPEADRRAAVHVGRLLEGTGDADADADTGEAAG